jgi:hypothetical protein
MSTAEVNAASRHEARRTVIAVAIAVALTVAVMVSGAWVFNAVHGPHDRPVSAEAYRVTTNENGGTDITIWVGAILDDAFTFVQVSELTDRVAVAIRERVVNGPTIGVLASYSFTFPLDEPIGSRIVVDVFSGKTLPIRPSP